MAFKSTFLVWIISFTETSPVILYQELEESELFPSGQIFVEFRHHAAEHYTKLDTLKIAERIRNLVVENYSLNDHNHLFRSALEKPNPTRNSPQRKQKRPYARIPSTRV